jgi:hypothetical protein
VQPTVVEAVSNLQTTRVRRDELVSLERLRMRGAILIEPGFESVER